MDHDRLKLKNAANIVEMTPSSSKVLQIVRKSAEQEIQIKQRTERNTQKQLRTIVIFQLGNPWSPTSLWKVPFLLGTMSYRSGVKSQASRFQLETAGGHKLAGARITETFLRRAEVLSHWSNRRRIGYRMG